MPQANTDQYIIDKLAELVKQEEDKQEGDKQIRFSKKIIIFCILFICLYTVVQVILAVFFSIELTPTLTTCVYTFFGTELAACMMIKIYDTKLKKSIYESNNPKRIEEPEEDFDYNYYNKLYELEELRHNKDKEGKE